jgi:hypothetical protein
MMKIVSLIPERSAEILSNIILPSLASILHILMDCPDGMARKAVSDFLGHLLLVTIYKFKVEFTPEDITEDDELTVENIIKLILKKLSMVLAYEKKDMSYKKLKGFFNFWNVLCKSNQELMYWIISNCNVVYLLRSNRQLTQNCTWTRKPAHMSRRMVTQITKCASIPCSGPWALS